MQQNNNRAVLDKREIITYRELLRSGERKLSEAGISDAAHDAKELFLHAFGLDMAQLLLRYDTAVDAFCTESAELFSENIERRAKREPLQHILGKAYFMGMEFKVSPDVLIPRPDTEILVETVLKDVLDSCEPENFCTFSGMKEKRNAEEKKISIDATGKDIDEKNTAVKVSAANDTASNTVITERIKDSPIRILDLCTGSGCIGIALSKLLKNTFSHKKTDDICVTLSDISEKALAAARENAELNGVSVSIVKSDLFEALRSAQKFDIIVSNPPYINEADMERLEPEVKEHDPHLALFGGRDGLDFYRRITKEAPDFLEKNGRLYFEIGYDQADAVSRLMAEHGFTDIRVIKDLAGLDRVVCGVHSPDKCI